MSASSRVLAPALFEQASPTATLLIWYVPFATLTDTALLQAYRTILTAQERAQEARFYFERDRRRYLVTRALVRTVLGRLVELDPGNLRFALNAYGRPELNSHNDACSRISFNISHTNELITLGVAHERTLGLDTENVTSRPAPIDIADSFFSPKEVRDLRTLPAGEQDDRFFDYWTLKESYIKARGLGLSIPLNRFSFRFPDDHSIILDIEPELADSPQRWMFYQYRLLTDHVVSICMEAAPESRVEVTINEYIPLVAARRVPCAPFRCSPGVL